MSGITNESTALPLFGHLPASVCVCGCMCVCVCVTEREREGERGSVCVYESCREWMSSSLTARPLASERVCA